MISIICPSRGRPHELNESLDSLKLAKHKLEALIWLDSNDSKLPVYQKLFKNNPNVRMFVKNRVGYIKLFVMLNFLSSQAKYNWVFVWNDDVVMTNPNWFTIFKNATRQFDPKNEPIVLNIWSQGEMVYNLFPVVSRCYLDILGHFAIIPNCDDWVRMVSEGAGIVHIIKGFKPKHRKYGGEDSLVDDTYRDVQRDRKEWKKVWNEKRNMIPKKEINEDIKKLIQYKNENN